MEIRAVTSATVKQIGGRTCYIYDCGSSDVLFIQPVDDHDIRVLDSEVTETVRLAGGREFTLAAFKVNDWNDDLSPWEAPAVFGDKGFIGGAEATLEYICEHLIPEMNENREIEIYIGGYSLAAFFALWAAYQRTGRLPYRHLILLHPPRYFPGKSYCF